MGDDRSSIAAREQNRSLLALDIRTQKLGFVVFDGPTKLLDWGTSRYLRIEHRPKNVVVKRISSLLGRYDPSVLVIRRVRVQSRSTSRRLKNIIKIVRAEANRRSVRVRILSAKTVKLFFAELGSKTKHEISTTLAEWFEEIAWKLPKKRKAWQGERYNVLIFDALATAVAFFGLRTSSTNPNGE